MSFQEFKRESIKRYMLNKIREDDEFFIQKTMENFSISITTVKRYIKECLEKDILFITDTCKTGYALTTKLSSFSYSAKSFIENPAIPSLNEDRIYFEDIYPLLKDVSPDAATIWSYTFMEMMNNAIEHSNCQNIYCIVKKDYLYTEISIVDDGIGIFKHIQNHLIQHFDRNATYQDVLTELYKGKLTTNPNSHSGEGIFFTSKVLHEFAIWSDDSIFSFGCYEKEQFVRSHLIAYFTKLNRIGTMVLMKLENDTTRKIGEVFNMYAPIEEGFIKTRIPIKEVCQYGQPIARSQARRILYRLEEFKIIEFDFDGIEFMGQGFADEIFRVFQNKYPDIELIPVGACPSVLGMIKHVTAGISK